jgi:hypothetical protein
VKSNTLYNMDMQISPVVNVSPHLKYLTHRDEKRDKMPLPFGVVFVKVAQQFGGACGYRIFLHRGDAKDVTLVVA